MTWAKIDCSLYSNPKILMAGPDARELFILIVLANANEQADGTIGGHFARPEYLAAALQRDAATVCNALQRCIQYDLLTVSDDEVSIVGWDKTWRVTTSTARAKKSKAAKKERELTALQHQGNVAERSGNKCNALDRERDRESREIDERDREIDLVAPRKRSAVSASDLEAAYQLYPKKVGKAAGLKKAKAQVKTVEALEAFTLAAEQMGKLWATAKASGSEQWQFCPQFDTWVSKRRYEDEQQAGPTADSSGRDAQGETRMERRTRELDAMLAEEIAEEERQRQLELSGGDDA